MLKKILLYATIGMALIGCGKTSNEKTLTMGCAADYPPFEYRQKGEIIGIDIDLAKIICNKLGYKLIVKDMQFSGLIGALNSGRIDFVMSGMTATEVRSKSVDFAQIYYQPQFAIIYKTENPIDEIGSLKGKKVGVQLGSTMELFVKEQSKRIGILEIKVLNRNLELIQELKLGRIDGVIIEKTQVVHYVNENPDLKYVILDEYEKSGYGIAFPKGSKLKDEFNRVIDEIKKNGTLEEIFKKWAIN